MISALVVLYILLIGLAVIGSLESYRLRKRFGLPFLRTFLPFVLISYAYAVMNFIGEVFAPAILSKPAESMIRVYLIVDLVTIPLLTGLFFLFFSPKTVKNHMTSIYAKTGARNRVQLANLLNRPKQSSGN